jgi:hypothetical protein
MTIKNYNQKKFEDMGIEKEFIHPGGQISPPTPPGTKAMQPWTNEGLVEDPDWKPAPTATAQDIAQAVKTHGYIVRLLANCGVRSKPEKVIAAVTAYVAYGNFQKASDDVEMQERTLRRWSEQEWWPEVVEYVNRVIDVKLESEMTGIIEKSLEQIADRIENGDFLTHQGKLSGERKPLDATQLTKLFATGFDKRLLQRGATRAVQGDSNQTTMGRLESIASRIEQAAEKSKAITREGVTIEGSTE